MEIILTFLPYWVLSFFCVVTLLGLFLFRSGGLSKENDPKKNEGRSYEEYCIVKELILCHRPLTSQTGYRGLPSLRKESMLSRVVLNILKRASFVL